MMTTAATSTNTIVHNCWHIAWARAIVVVYVLLKQPRPLFRNVMMKRVMSAPVGASRATQQQSGNSNSGASIGTAAFHPRSPNVALDPVRHVMPFLSVAFCVV